MKISPDRQPHGTYEYADNRPESVPRGDTHSSKRTPASKLDEVVVEVSGGEGNAQPGRAPNLLMPRTSSQPGRRHVDGSKEPGGLGRVAKNDTQLLTGASQIPSIDWSKLRSRYPKEGTRKPDLVHFPPTGFDWTQLSRKLSHHVDDAATTLADKYDSIAKSYHGSGDTEAWSDDDLAAWFIYGPAFTTWKHLKNSKKPELLVDKDTFTKRLGAPENALLLQAGVRFQRAKIIEEKRIAKSNREGLSDGEGRALGQISEFLNHAGDALPHLLEAVAYENPKRLENRDKMYQYPSRDDLLLALESEYPG